MDFYHHVIQIEGFSMMLAIALCFVLPMICIVHCLLSKRTWRAKLVWTIALLLTLIFAAIAYLLVNATRHPWLGWLIGGFIFVLIFNAGFPLGWHWFIVKDAHQQEIIAKQTLATLKVDDLNVQQRSHVYNFTHVAIMVARDFSGNYADAPPVAKRALLEAVTYLRLFNALTKDGELSKDHYEALFSSHVFMPLPTKELPPGFAPAPPQHL